MKPAEVICEMRGSGIDSLAHITVQGSHRYYVTIDQLKRMPDSVEIKVLSMEVKHLRTQDVVGKAPATNKKRLYNVR